MNHGASQGDEVSWMAVSNNNPPTRGTTRLGPPTTTTTSVPPPPPPMFQEADTPLPPPLQPDMLLNMGYPQGTTWVLEEGVWQPIFPGEAQGAPASQATSSQQYHSGWSIFAAGDSGHTGSASSQGGQYTTGGNPEVTGHQPNHQQPQLQQPRQLPQRSSQQRNSPGCDQPIKQRLVTSPPQPQPSPALTAAALAEHGPGKRHMGIRSDSSPLKWTLEAQIRACLRPPYGPLARR